VRTPFPAGVLPISPMAGPRFPNLFIAGVPKAATTTWYQALDHHPDVFMSPRKEMRYLDRDLTFDNRVETEDAYLAHFADAEGQARIGEASPWYFYSDEAPRSIRDNAEDPRVLVFLRDPVERLYSLHGQMVNSGAETIGSFREALAAQPDRERGRRLPDLLEPREGLRYWDIAHYGPHVRRYLDTFDDEELMFVRFDDFTTDPEGVFREVCTFLGVDPNVRPAIPASNTHRVLRSHRVRDFLADPPEPVREIAHRVPGDWPTQARDILWQLNLKPAERDPMPEDLCRTLTEHCRPDIEDVEDLLGWDLSDWRRRDPLEEA